MRRCRAAWACRACLCELRNWRSSSPPAGSLRRRSPTRLNELESERRNHPPHRTGIAAGTDPARHRRPTRAVRRRLFDLAQDGAQVDRLRTILRHLRLSHRRRQRRGLLLACWASCTKWPTVPGRSLALHLDAEAERLSFDPHHRRRSPATNSASNCRSVSREMNEIARSASPRTLYKDRPVADKSRR